jgi:asparagine synthase (glutamine-hydrolysing)
MCGISGIIDFTKRQNEQDGSKMINILQHRGPDFQKTVVLASEYASVVFSHARLSIIDLSKEANQPMLYKQYTIVFNGEIYNFNEIKHKLINLGHVFSLHSDTEVLLHSYEEWGTKCLTHL